MQEDYASKKKKIKRGPSKIFYLCRFMFALYMIWFGMNMLKGILVEKHQRYIKKTFVAIRKYIDTNHPHFLSSKIFDYDKLLAKTNSINNFIAYSIIVGGVLCAIGFSAGNFILFFGILFNLFFIYNRIYYREEPSKANIYKVLALLGGTYYTWEP